MNRAFSSEPVLNAPAVVLALIGIFVVIHAIRSLLPAEWDLWVILAFAFIPARYVLPAGSLPGGLGADFWTFVTHMLLHGSWAHLLVNSFWMLAFGTLMARRLGTAGFLVLTVVSGIAGALLHLIIYWGAIAPVIGASAGISGQMGAAIRLMFSDPGGLLAAARRDQRFTRPLSIRETFTMRGPLTFIIVWFGINLVFGLLSFGANEGGTVAWQAHIGGFLAGLLAFAPIDRWARRYSYSS
ncbi:rhomboid family intramembrane serine protease [Rhodoligotrophos defluvii]|uniref:rhomboid family intramembrane serine protease n=1 Tax=Rhodoligotrophos defluvii TaxID=2561934 RepID=UPI0010C9C862|nr:rhomboid family intramembrane serine protease [Rhodoligotrophos defluvii]